MKSKILIVIWCFCCAAGLWAQQKQEYVVHTVSRGETILSISKMYGVATGDILKANGLSGDRIYAGDTLRIPLKDSEQTKQTFHTIQVGETLYQLSVRYGVPIDKICAANPGLREDNFKAGAVIVIPLDKKTSIPEAEQKQNEAASASSQSTKDKEYRTLHKVKRRETIFGIAREYGVTQEELIAANPEIKYGLKKDDILFIPYHETEQNPVPSQEAASQEAHKNVGGKKPALPAHLDALNVSLALPFTKAGKESSRMVEFYEGLLVALDDLKKGGVSVNLNVYDSYKTPINSIVGSDGFARSNLVIGPYDASNIKSVAAFCKKRDIPFVVPFSSQVDEVFNTPTLFQINTPQSYLYSEVYACFVNHFRENCNVIFVDCGSKNDKKEFINGFKHELDANGIKHVAIKSEALLDGISGLLALDEPNVVVPMSGTHSALSSILPALQNVARNAEAPSTHLFGYPEWQTYTGDFLTAFYEIDTYFYSSFYTNSLFKEAMSFTNKYQNWYRKDMANTYPKYGMLGYDIMMYFGNALWKYGSGLYENLDAVKFSPVQTGFAFGRVNNWGGFINKKVFFIHFCKDRTLQKIDF